MASQALIILCLIICADKVSAKLSVRDKQPYFPNLITSYPSQNFIRGRVSSENYADRPLVTTLDGTLRGFTLRTVGNREVHAFQSIPFAKPPVGYLRFQDPIQNEPWSGIRDAMPPSPQCIQLDLMRGLEVHGSEDCLYLNVYKPRYPNSSYPLPVLVWIHGGGYFFGAGSIYGPRYLLNHDVILVTLNYRLGPFGFLTTGNSMSPGNQGLKDQVLALKWVQRNIYYFGGNPQSVTIFGESVGSVSVGLHVVSPLSRGLFHRAIGESMSALCYFGIIPDGPNLARRVGQEYNCTQNNSREMIRCLQGVPAENLAPVQAAFIEWYLFPIVVFGPTIEHYYPGAFMTKTPEDYYEQGQAQNVTMIAGQNRDEMVFLVGPIMNNQSLVDDLNARWNEIGPIVLGLKDTETETKEERVARIWDFYMGHGQKLTWDSRQNFARLLTDRYVTECTFQQMRYHTRYTQGHVYAYLLTYQGRFSILQKFGDDPKDWGVSHMDDLIYLLDCPDYYQTLQETDPEWEMSKIMTGMWANFARHGKPFPNLEGGYNIWQATEKAKNDFSPLKFLDLNLYLKMIDDPYVERYNFWRNDINPNP